MNYTDSSFLILFLIVWLCAVLLKNCPAIKEWLLVACSLFIFATWGYYDCNLFVGIVLVNYLGVSFMAKPRSRQAKCILIVLICFNLGSLIFFKYSAFILANAAFLTGVKLTQFPLGIPLAISFYTFHLISFLVDTYTGKVGRISFRSYCFYLSFFPHVIAGPIIRAWQLAPQLGRVRTQKAGDGVWGLHYFITGFFLKVVAADNIGIGINEYWTDATVLAAGDRWCLAFLFYCEIYGDFAGYSLMAIGMARLLGYRFPANFRSPMTAVTLRQFWQRWHITLSKFLRDYLYIPLGGNRVSHVGAMLTVMVTMLLGGLWHGPGWSFIVWGGIHGVGILIERAMLLRRFKDRFISVVCSFLFTQICVLVAWVFFREHDTVLAMKFVRGMFFPDLTNTLLTKPPLVGLLIFSIPILLHNIAPIVLLKLKRQHLAKSLGISTAVMLLLSILTLTKSTVFIYFKF